MNKPKIVVVIPTVRPEQYKLFISAWENLFKHHEVILVTVWDGEVPRVEIYNYNTNSTADIEYQQTLYQTHKELVYRYTDACRNLGFIVAAHLNPDYVLTLDDDVEPCKINRDDRISKNSSYRNDPIQEHLDVLQKRVCIDWMNTAHNTDLFLRGVPYDIRSQAPAMLSHGVWVGTPDFDGETQLKLEQPYHLVKCPNCNTDLVKSEDFLDRRTCNTCSYQDQVSKGQVPYSLPYYVGPIPKGVLFPLCGMNVMVKREALSYLYFAPMGKDTGIVDKEDKSILNRFADIWMGISLKKKFDALGWACYTGGSTVLHTRASDAKKNFEQEKLGREWNEQFWKDQGTTNSNYFNDMSYRNYFYTYNIKIDKFNRLITSILGSSSE